MNRLCILFLLLMAFNVDVLGQSDSATIFKESDSQSNYVEIRRADYQSKNDTEVMPSPKEGMTRFTKFIGSKFRFSKEMLKAKLHGQLLASFVVEHDGSLTGFVVLKDLGYGTKEEYLRVLEYYAKKRKWSPGMQDGKPIKVGYFMPIRIDLR